MIAQFETIDDSDDVVIKKRTHTKRNGISDRESNIKNDSEQIEEGEISQLVCLNELYKK